MYTTTSSVNSDRIKLQIIIRERYPELVREYSLEYCVSCLSYPACILLPVTSSGEVCPYFERAITASTSQRR
jgi:hypothetical protein